MRFFTALTFGLLLLVATHPAAAQQSLFQPRVLVNSRAVTNYEVAQRVLFLKLLRTPGDVEAEALKALIEDRLRLDAAAAMDLKLSDEDLATGMQEFAGRAQLSTDEFLQAISQAGIDAQTFRDFVAAGLIWRNVVRERFAAQTGITEADIDRALSLPAQRGAVRVLLSELVIPALPGQTAEAEALAVRLSAALRGEAAFAAAASTYSASASRERGGRIDWVPLANLPAQLAPILLQLSPGEVSPPVPIPNAIALFLLRAVGQVDELPASAVNVSYAEYLIPGGRTETTLSEAAEIRAKVDTCDDLYAIAAGQPAERLIRSSATMAEVPADIGLELARLDEGEASTALVRGGSLVYLMLCSRQAVAAEPPSREAVRLNILNERLNGLSDAYLAELKADAHIVTP